MPSSLTPAHSPLPKDVAQWIHNFRAAASAGHIVSVRAMIGNLPTSVSNNHHALRKTLTPLARLGLVWEQLKIWQVLLQLRPDLYEAEIERLLRIAGKTVIIFEKTGPELPAARQAFFETLIEASLRQIDLSSRSCMEILKVGAFCYRKPREPGAIRIIAIAASRISTADLASLVKQSQAFDKGWFPSFCRHFVGANQLEAAEWVARRLYNQAPKNPQTNYQLLDVFVRRKFGDQALKFINRGALGVLSYERASILINRILRLKLCKLEQIMASTPTHIALHLYVDFAGAKRLPADLAIIVKELSARPIANLLQDATQILITGDSETIKGLRSLADDLRLFGASPADPFLEFCNYVNQQNWTQAAALMAHVGVEGDTLTSLSMLPAFTGLMCFTDFCSSASEAVMLSEREADAVISFKAVSRHFDLERKLKQESGMHLRWGPTSAEEVNHGIVATDGIRPAHNSQEDFQSAYLAQRVAAAGARQLACLPADGTQADYLKEAIELCIEDRLFHGLKAKNAVIKYLKSINGRRIGVIASAGHVMLALELAYMLEASGFIVYFGIDRTTQAENQAIVAAVASSNGNQRGVVLKYGLAQLGTGGSAPLPLIPAKRKSYPTSGRSILLMCSLNDSSYQTASVALWRELSLLCPVEVYNGAPIGAFAFTCATGCEPFDNDTELMQACNLEVCAALRHLLAFLMVTDLENDAITWLIANTSQLIQTVKSGLTFQIYHDRRLEKRLALNDISLLVTVPGRMTCARTATILMQSKGLPCVDVQVLFISEHPRYRPSLANVYCGISEDQIAIYRAKNPKPTQRTVRIGSLMVDAGLRRIRTHISSNRNVETSRSKATIVYGAQHGEGLIGEEAIRFMVRATKALPNCRLIIKLHPRAPVGAVLTVEKLVADECGVDVVVQREGDIYAIMSASELVVTRFSNVGLEAAVLGRPVISINTSGRDYVVDLSRMGLAKRASSYEDLARLVHDLINDLDFRSRHLAEQDAYFLRNPELRQGKAARTISSICSVYLPAAMS